MGAHYPQMLKYIYVGVSVCRCSRHILVSSALLHSLCPVSTFSPASLLLEDLLCAGGRDVQESPGCVWVQLFLVTTQRPNIHHSHHLPLLRWREEQRSVPKRQYGEGGGLFYTWVQLSERERRTTILIKPLSYLAWDEHVRLIFKYLSFSAV